MTLPRMPVLQLNESLILLESYNYFAVVENTFEIPI